jgi:DNA replication protein DnaC
VAILLADFFNSPVAGLHADYQKSTIMTSNRPLEDWGKLLGDVPSATAILDRFLHHAEIITITGRSYRLKDRAGNNNIKEDKDNNDGAGKKSKPD